MGIGVGIFFIAIGAILAFAVDAQVSGIDVQVIGFILIGAGILGIVLELLLFAPRRRHTVVNQSTVPVANQPVAQAPIQAQPVVQQATPYRVDENGRPIQ